MVFKQDTLYSELAEANKADGEIMTNRYPDLASFPCHTTVTVPEFASLAEQTLETLLSVKVNGGCQ